MDFQLKDYAIAEIKEASLLNIRFLLLTGL